MKIAYVLPEFPRRYQTFILSQLEGLLALGHDVTVIAPRPEDEVLDREAERTCGVLRRRQPRLPERRLTRTLSGLALAARHGWRYPVLVARALDPLRFGRYALSFAALHAAVPLLDRPAFDVVHCHFGPGGVIGAILRDLGLLRAPMIVTFYGHDVTRYPNQHPPDVYRRLFARADLVLALDPLMRERLQQLGADPARLDIHPLGVDVSRFEPTSAPPQPPLRVLSVGRFVEKKGFADALRAAALLRDRGVALTWRIAGDGPLREELQRMVHELSLGDIVEFLGRVTHADVPPLLASSHVLVTPSVRAADGDEEGTPTVIIEAMACAIPVVATRHAGIPSLVEDGVTGWLVDEREPTALADRIARLAGDPDLVARLGGAGRSAAAERFDVGRLSADLVTRYRFLMKGSQGPEAGF